jgi:hypothetical protein
MRQNNDIKNSMIQGKYIILGNSLAPIQIFNAILHSLWLFPKKF